MKRELEDKLRAGIVAGRAEGRFPRDVIADMLAAGDIQNAKQAWRTLEKWKDYEYGSVLDLGWFKS